MGIHRSNPATRSTHPFTTTAGTTSTTHHADLACVQGGVGKGVPRI